MSAVGEIPAGSNIHGRPILDELPGIRHIAFDRDGQRFTWCGRTVPPQEETEDRLGAVMDCYSCHQRYRDLACQPWE